jgi:hypothetical protein
MAIKPYQDKDFLFQHYVKRRMTHEQIVVLLAEKYNVKTTPQTIHNWCDKYDLLRLRGKGRKLSRPKKHTGKPSMAQRDAERRKNMKNRRRTRGF